MENKIQLAHIFKAFIKRFDHDLPIIVQEIMTKTYLNQI